MSYLVPMAAIADIVKDLERLPERELERAADIIHRLATRRAERRLKAINSLEGAMDGELGNAFAEAIKDCEQIDEDSW